MIDVLSLLKFGGKYCFCGVGNQYSPPLKQIPVTDILAFIIENNITIIGSCLGETNDLHEALNDFTNHDLRIPIAYKGDDPFVFLKETFVSKTNLGKVIFSYT